MREKCRKQEEAVISCEKSRKTGARSHKLADKVMSSGLTTILAGVGRERLRFFVAVLSVVRSRKTDMKRLEAGRR